MTVFFSSFDPSCGRQVHVVCTQPRRLAAVSLASRPAGCRCVLRRVSGCVAGGCWDYPLVNIQKATENGHRNSGFTH